MKSRALPEALLARHFRRQFELEALFKSDHEEGSDLCRGYGSFHQVYRIDGHLMAGTRASLALALYCYHYTDARNLTCCASNLVSDPLMAAAHVVVVAHVLSPVSVVDVLPGRFVSAYSFYNPDYRHMEWGRYTALREIFWTQQVGVAFD